MTNVQTYLESLGMKTWEKNDTKRVYINDLTKVGINELTLNPKAFRRVSVYYDVNKDIFVTDGVTGSRVETIDALIAHIREQAN